jgi:mRNA interferase RelE/StbE
MPDYSSFARSARKELERLSDEIADRVLTKIEAVGQNPRPVGFIKLHGQKNLWPMRVGDYRVVYSIDDLSKTVDVSIIRHRREVYHL